VQPARRGKLSRRILDTRDPQRAPIPQALVNIDGNIPIHIAARYRNAMRGGLSERTRNSARLRLPAA